MLWFSGFHWSWPLLLHQAINVLDHSAFSMTSSCQTEHTSSSTNRTALLLPTPHLSSCTRMRISNKMLNLSTNLFFRKWFSFSSNLKSKRAAPKGIYQLTTLTLFSLPQLPRDRNKSASLQTFVMEITWISKEEIVCKMRCHSLRAHKSLRWVRLLNADQISTDAGAFQLGFKPGSLISTMAQTQHSWPANAESLADPWNLSIKRPGCS